MSAVAERVALPASRARSAKRRRSRRNGPTLWRGRILGRLGVVLIDALGRLPLVVSLRLGELAGLLVYLCDVRHRRIGMRNLAIAFPDKPVSERRRILRASLINLGRTAIEIAYLAHADAAAVSRMVRFSDEALWHRVMEGSRETGLLVLAGHFGNWELLVYTNALRGYPVSLVHRTIRNPAIDHWLNGVRARAGTRLVRKASAARDVLRTLKEKGILVMPFDQNSTRDLGVFVDFFGLPASTTSGLARVGLRSGVPVFPVFPVREGGTGRHVVHPFPPLHLERTGDMEQDVRRATQQLSDVFEDMVRRYPEQWLWVHRRWKTRPPGEQRFY